MRWTLACVVALAAVLCAAGGGASAAGGAPASSASARAAAGVSCEARRSASGRQSGASRRAAARCRARARARRSRALLPLLGTVRGALPAAPAAWVTAGPPSGPSAATGGSVSTPVAAPTGFTPAPSPQPTPTPSPAAPPRPDGPPPPPPLPEDDPYSVKVSATEFALTLSQLTVSAGDVRVEFDNSRAEDPHDLVVDPAGSGESYAFGRLDPGDVSARTLALQAGDYKLYCSLLDHEALGMSATLSVAG